jgi:ABC-type Na+ efflux pump permease subunit
VPTNNKTLTTGKVVAIFLVTLALGLVALLSGVPHTPSTPLVTVNSHTGKSLTCYSGVNYGSKTDCARALTSHSNGFLIAVGVLLIVVAAAVGVLLVMGLSRRSRAQLGRL